MWCRGSGELDFILVYRNSGEWMAVPSAALQKQLLVCNISVPSAAVQKQ